MRRCSGAHMVASAELLSQRRIEASKQSVLPLQAVAVDVRGLADSLKALVESGMHKAAGMLRYSNYTAVMPASPGYSLREQTPCQTLTVSLPAANAWTVRGVTCASV